MDAIADRNAAARTYASEFHIFLGFFPLDSLEKPPDAGRGGRNEGHVDEAAANIRLPTVGTAPRLGGRRA